MNRSGPIRGISVGSDCDCLFSSPARRSRRQRATPPTGGCGGDAAAASERVGLAGHHGSLTNRSGPIRGISVGSDCNCIFSSQARRSTPAAATGRPTRRR